jgi:hypothetical protein
MRGKKSKNKKQLKKRKYTFIRKLWTPDELAIMEILYPDTDTRVIAKGFGRTVISVGNQAALMGVKKTPEYLSALPSKKFLKAGAKTRFKKGNISFNKGKTWGEFMSKQGQKNSLKTAFKKGNVPTNTKEKDGVITSRHHKRSNWTEKFIRISIGKWIPLRHYNWEKVNGKVPKGMIVALKNPSLGSYEVENLELITKAQNMARNTIIRYPEEVQQTMRVLKKLNRTIVDKKQKDGKKQN